VLNTHQESTHSAVQSCISAEPFMLSAVSS
jgi:hypothetical protein